MDEKDDAEDKDVWWVDGEDLANLICGLVAGNCFMPRDQLTEADREWLHSIGCRWD